MRDNITVEIAFDSSKSWVDPALQSNIDQLILDHERGHYNITALFGRDMFIDMMQLKPNAYPTVADGQNAVAAVFNRYQAALTKAQAVYDSDTVHGTPALGTIGPPRKGLEQNRWEGFINTAFTTVRTPAESSPVDNKPYKARLIDILTAAGKI